MAKRKPEGIKALFVAVPCLEHLRFAHNGRGDSGDLQMLPAASLCSCKSSPFWQLLTRQLCHRGLDSTEALRSQLIALVAASHR